jgi:hypothetical protein
VRAPLHITGHVIVTVSQTCSTELKQRLRHSFTFVSSVLPGLNDHYRLLVLECLVDHKLWSAKGDTTEEDLFLQEENNSDDQEITPQPMGVSKKLYGSRRLCLDLKRTWTYAGRPCYPETAIRLPLNARLEYLMFGKHIIPKS